MTCDLSFSEHTHCDDGDHQAARERRAASAPAWGQLATGVEPNRLYLYGQPVHCGEAMELQAQRYGDDDFGSFVLLLPAGVRVRYELEWLPGGKTRHVVFTTVGGYDFLKPIDTDPSGRFRDGMRFRWPPK